MQEQILTLMIPVMTLLFAAGFAALWWLDRSRIYVLAFAGWFLAVTIGITLQAWLFADFGPLEVALFHTVSCAGLLALTWGIARRDEAVLPFDWYVACCVISGVIVAYASHRQVSAVLIMAQNFNAGLLYALCAFGKWNEGSRHLADRFLLATLAIMAAYSMFRPSIVILIQSQMTMAEYQSSVLLTANLVMTAFITLLIASSLFACIVSDRLHSERSEATIDPLTKLPNRRAFEEAAADMLVRGRAENRHVSLLVADIDHFKHINDTHGHVTGDQVIAGFGSILASKIRATDVAGRVGGEEFCVVVWNCKAGAAARLADRIRATVEGMNRRDEDTGVPAYTASFGVAQARKGEGYTSLFQRADAALYAAKNSGRNCVAIADGEPGEELLDAKPLQRNTAEAPEDRAKVVPLVRRQSG